MWKAKAPHGHSSNTEHHHRLGMTLYLKPNRPGPLEYFLSILCIYWQGHKLSIKHPSVYLCSSALSVCLCLFPSLWVLKGVSYYHRDERCKWRQLSTWHPGSEFPPPPGRNRGFFLHLFLSLFSSPPPLKCVTLFFFLPTLSLSLYNCPWCLYFLSLSYIPATLQLLPKWPMTSHVSLHVLETTKTLTPKRAQLNTRMLLLFTPLRLHRATHGCRGRRSTPPQHDGAPLMMPSERVGTHKPTQHLWSPAGPWSSSGSTRTRDLRRQRGGSQMKTFLSYYLLLTSHIAQYSLVIRVLYEGKRQMRLFTKDNHPTREG